MPPGDLTLEFKKKSPVLDSYSGPIHTALQAELLQIYLATGKIPASSKMECPHISYKFQSNLYIQKYTHTF